MLLQSAMGAASANATVVANDEKASHTYWVKMFLLKIINQLQF